ncbi:BCL-2-associated athanogene 4 isoform 3 [Theobroma cacao]|uniref:BCL-2-associated athanogene 4 isoform 3 n=2 Tax=Theobroma cacao TaxID=3641 RepID=A0A061GYK1_THECC|nr:BCL-2-associated athanogene 4 isoform 3 [Theobroma cacao]
MTSPCLLNPLLVNHFFLFSFPSSSCLQLLQFVGRLVVLVFVLETVLMHISKWDLKRVLAQETGLEPKEQRLLFQGKEKDDEECLHMVGVKDMSKVVLLEDPASKERKLDEMKRNQSILKAYEEVAKVRAEVDKLSEKVIALEAIVRGGTKVSEKKFLVLTELLMVQLLQLDTIEANGEAKVQRKVEVRHVQGLVDTLDNLKARNSNPFSSSCNAVSVTTKWEAFESGVGSLTAPAPLPSSTRITQDWEVFD